jgi:hypothetical protein
MFFKKVNKFSTQKNKKYFCVWWDKHGCGSNEPVTAACRDIVRIPLTATAHSLFQEHYGRRTTPPPCTAGSGPPIHVQIRVKLAAALQCARAAEIRDTARAERTAPPC